MVRVAKLLIAFFCIISYSFAALSANTVWELRASVGSDNNGGGFVTGATGVDYSQQDSAQYSASDLVLVTTTTCSSATHSFDANDVGNILHITAGTNFTAGFYQILSTAAGVATLDRAAGTMGATGGTYAVGGALATLGTVVPVLVAGQTTYLKATATYTLTSSLSLGVSQVKFLGYNTVRTEWEDATIGTRPLITTATNSTPIWTTSTNPQSIGWYNLRFSNTAGTRSSWISGSQWFNSVLVKVQLDGFTQHFNGTTFDGSRWYQCEVMNGTSHGIVIPNNGSRVAIFIESYIHDNTGSGINNSESQNIVTINSVFANNTGNGLLTGANLNQTTISNSVFYNNGTDGVRLDGTNNRNVHIWDSIFFGNTGYGVNRVNAITVTDLVSGGANTYGDNTSGARNNFPALAGDVAITVDPFTNPGASDFSLNSTAGGGADLKAVGYPGVAIFGTGYVDIGALQSQAGGGAGTPVSYGIAQ